MICSSCTTDDEADRKFCKECGKRMATGCPACGAPNAADAKFCGECGGTLEKFIGDAVMAVWGAPTAHKDDAERAVRAGLELVDAVGTRGPRIQARAGVLTGEAAVTIGATNQGMVAGDLVNTASRLQSAAAPGTVLVGEATERAASRAIAFEPVGKQALKGKSSRVPAWRALRVVAERGGRNRFEALEAPFVGRDDEPRQLRELFDATSRDRRARLVSVLGPAGHRRDAACLRGSHVRRRPRRERLVARRSLAGLWRQHGYLHEGSRGADSATEERRPVLPRPPFGPRPALASAV